MRDRKKSLERLLQVKSQLHKLDEARLEDIRRRKAELDAERRALFDILNDVEKTDPLILGLACRQIAHSRRRETALESEEQEQKTKLFTGAAQKKALEKVVKETARAADREYEKQQLLEIGERLAANGRSSLP